MIHVAQDRDQWGLFRTLMKCWKFVELLRNCWLFGNDSASCISYGKWNRLKTVYHNILATYQPNKEPATPNPTKGS